MGDISAVRRSQIQQDLQQFIRITDFGVDTVSFSWVKDYLKDLHCRDEIKVLQGQIQATEKLPIAREELEAAFLANLEAFKISRSNILREHLKNAQKHRVDLLSPANGFATIGNAWPNFLTYLDDLTDQEIESLFSCLEDGYTLKEKGDKISALEARIRELNNTIETELSPHERWFYMPSGSPIRYPEGCRWTRFVKTWKEVASRHFEPVDIEGYKITKGAEWEAYNLLSLEKVYKKTPLRGGADRNRR